MNFKLAFTVAWLLVPLLWASTARAEDLAAGSNDPALAKIISTLDQWAKSITTIRLQFEARTPSESPEWKEFREVADWCFTDSKQMRFYSTTTRDEETLVRDLWIYDRDRVTTAIYPRGASTYEKPERVNVGRPRYYHGGIKPLWAVWNGGTFEWLPDILKTAAAGGPPIESKAGGQPQTLRVALDNSDPNRPKINFTVEHSGQVDLTSFVLDPDHGFLPVHTEDGAAGKVKFENDVTEFRRLESGIWFPWSGSFTVHRGKGYPGNVDKTVSKWAVLEVSINERIDPTLFQAPIGVGTEVSDDIANRHYVHGQHPAAQKAAEQRAQTAGPASHPPAENATPKPYLRPKSPGWLPWTVGSVALGVALLGAAFVVRSRQSRRLER